MTSIATEFPRNHVVDRPSSRYADMIWIPGGTFRMGSDKHDAEEAPVADIAQVVRFPRLAGRPDHHRGKPSSACSTNSRSPPRLENSPAPSSMRPSPAISSCCWCSFRISLGASSTGRLAKGGLRECFYRSGVGSFVIRRLCSPTETVLNHTWRPSDGTCNAK